MELRTFIAGGVAAFLFASCASMSSVVEQKNDGTARIYEVGQKRAWEIVQTILRWVDVEEVEEHRSDNYVLASTGANLISYGSVLGVWVEPVSDRATKITIVSKRRMSTNVASGMKESTFHDYFEYALEQDKAGKPLPESAPLLDEK
jgi:hypothetical protein